MTRPRNLNRLRVVPRSVPVRGLIGLIVPILVALILLNRRLGLDSKLILISLVILTAFWLITVYVSLYNRTGSLRTWFIDYSKDISPELFGAILTTILFTVIVGSAQQSQAEVELKAQLIRQLGSSINTEAIRAIEELRAHGWVSDGTLQGAYLGRANLQGADLSGANLQGAFLMFTNLQGADLSNADLENAQLAFANLQDANLWVANLKSADLWEANLQGTTLIATWLDENTTLPDGNYLSTDFQRHRFTDPNHPNFWRSDNPSSPAYRAPSN